MDYKVNLQKIVIKLPTSNHNERKLLLEKVDWIKKSALDSVLKWEKDFVYEIFK